MSNINFVVLYESVLSEMFLIQEAERTNLADIARQADEFRTQYKQSPEQKVKDNAIHQLVVLRSFVVDEINSELPLRQKKTTDEQIDKKIYTLLSNREFEGLRHLLSKNLPQREKELNVNWKKPQ